MRFDDFAKEVIWGLKSVEFVAANRELSAEDFLCLLVEEMSEDVWDWGPEVDSFVEKSMTDPDFELKLYEGFKEW